MKKYILIFFCIGCTFTNWAQEVFIPDSIFRNAALRCDSNRDGVITVEEAATLTRISIGDYPNKVKSLEGIEFFENLEQIQIGDLETEVVVDLSKNVKLKQIIIIDAGLKNINLGSLENLEILWLDINELTFIDVSGCINLKNLNLGWNKFKNIDVSKNLNLQTLSIMHNQLDSLDLRACVKMHNGYYKYVIGQPREGLSCEGNPNLKVVCIAENNQQNYWFKDEQTVFSTTCAPTGVAAAQGNTALVLYPNPANEIVNIATPLAVGGSLILINSLGEQVQQQNIVAEKTQLNVTLLPKGLYIVALRHQDGTMSGQSKVVVE